MQTSQQVGADGVKEAVVSVVEAVDEGERDLRFVWHQLDEKPPSAISSAIALP